MLENRQSRTMMPERRETVSPTMTSALYLAALSDKVQGRKEQAALLS
jgi:hypothetical protein